MNVAFVVILKALRIENAIHPLLAVVAGFVAASGNNTANLALVLVATLFIHSAVTLWNDIEDREVDRRNNRTQVAALYAGGMRRTLWTVVATLIAVGTILVLRLPVATLSITLLFVLFGWAYNSRPLQLSRRPLGSVLTLFVTYGALPFAIGASLGTVDGHVVLLGLGWALVRVSLSLLKDFKDATGDAESHKKTFLLVYGKRAVERWSFILAAVGFIVMDAILVSRSISTNEIALVAVSVWLLIERARLFGTKTYRDLNMRFHEQMMYQLLFDGLVVLCLTT